MSTVIDRSYPRLFRILNRTEIDTFRKVILCTLGNYNIPAYVYSKVNSSYFNNSEVEVPIITNVFRGTEIDYDTLYLYCAGTLFKMTIDRWGLTNPGWVESIHGEMYNDLHKWKYIISSRLYWIDKAR